MQNISDRSTTVDDICFALYQVREKHLSPDPEVVAREAGCAAGVALKYLQDDPTLRALANSIKNHTGSVYTV